MSALLPTAGCLEADNPEGCRDQAATDLRDRILWPALLPVVPLLVVLGTVTTMLVIADRSFLGAALTLCALAIVSALLIGLIVFKRTKNDVGRLLRRHDAVRDGTAVPSSDAASTSDGRPSPSYGNDALQTAFAKLARGLEAMADRAITEIDEAEHQVEDPDLLARLFRVDHLVNLSRRQAESLAILGGKAPQRQTQEDVSLQTVLRSAVAEIEHYSRVKMTAVGGTLKGPATAEVIHLLAELLENATQFSSDNTPVVVRTETVTAGVAIEIQDRGLGMTSEEIHRYNRLLEDADRVDLDELLADGRIGLSVVRVLAQRYDIRVRLQTSIYGGMEAVVLLPDSLLSTSPREPAQPGHIAQDLTPTPPASGPPPRVSRSYSASRMQWTGEVAEPVAGPWPEEDASAPPTSEPASTPQPAPAAPPSTETMSSPAGKHRRRGDASQLPQRRPGTDNLPEPLRTPRESVTPIPGHNTGLLSALGQSETDQSASSEDRKDPSTST
ncbi:Signal transduction histidine kinase [Actinopolyspora xinjiangensis]|uniref:histidine kinase n=1 Tax=Actinopolyspora xinjiangensis TaxID=405564 RepID=A0A1H0WZX2_9ACTN|nr:ATP-binding protein [Actinopolyspora xinjiangensis]SDP95776.1 Signal transduction histidine kinase [Actinopolyspora xinjiangensis]